MTMKAVAFESQPEINGFVEKLAIFLVIKKLLTALHADDNIFYFNEDSSDVIFSCNEMGILSVDLYNINLDDTNYDKDDLEAIIRVRRFA